MLCAESQSSLRELNSENKELRLLSNKLVDKVKKLEEEALSKTKKIIEIQEKTMDCLYLYPTPCTCCYPGEQTVGKDGDHEHHKKRKDNLTLFHINLGH